MSVGQAANLGTDVRSAPR